jgi:hypothetical protein
MRPKTSLAILVALVFASGCLNLASTPACTEPDADQSECYGPRPDGQMDLGSGGHGAGESASGGGNTGVPQASGGSGGGQGLDAGIDRAPIGPPDTGGSSHPDASVDSAPVAPGSILWIQKVGYGRSLAADNNGVVVSGYFGDSFEVAGHALSNAGLIDGFIAAYAKDGTPGWAQSSSGALNESLTSVQLDDDGGPIVVGYSTSDQESFAGRTVIPSAGQNDLLAKFDRAGKLLWLDQVAGEYVGASTGRPIVSGDFGRFARYDHRGQSVAASTVELPHDARAAAIDLRGDVLIVGDLTAPAQVGGKAIAPTGMSDVYVAKFGTAGVAWVTTIAGDGAEKGLSIAVDAIGDVLVAGSFDQNLKGAGAAHQTVGMSDVFVSKLASRDGALLWSRTFGTIGLDEGCAVAPYENDLVLVGASSGRISLGGDATEAGNGFVARLAGSTGEHVWSRGMNSKVRAVATTDNALYVAGDLFLARLSR